MGVTYTHWASDSCPSGSMLIYSGNILLSASTNYRISQPLCLTMEVNNTNPIDVETSVPTQRSSITCAQCLMPAQSTIFTNHGSSVCPNGWNLVYNGWMAVLPNAANLTSTLSPFCATDGNTGGVTNLLRSSSISFLELTDGSREQLACSLCSM